MKQSELFNILSLGIIHLNREGKVISANATAEKILDIPSVELKNSFVWDSKLRFKTVKGEKLTIERNPLKTALANKENILKTILGIELNDGNTRWVECDIIYQQPIATKEPCSITVCLKDITQMFEIENRYKAVFDSSPYILAINDLTNNQFVDVNREFLSYRGMEKEAIIGKTPYELGNIISNELSNTIRDIFLKEGKLKQFEYNHPGKTGNDTSLLWVEAIEVLGKKYSLTAMQNITNLKIAEQEIRKSEAKYRILYEQMFDAFVRVDISGKIISAESFAAQKGNNSKAISLNEMSAGIYILSVTDESGNAQHLRLIKE